MRPTELESADSRLFYIFGSNRSPMRDNVSVWLKRERVGELQRGRTFKDNCQAQGHLSRETSNLRDDPEIGSVMGSSTHHPGNLAPITGPSGPAS